MRQNFTTSRAKENVRSLISLGLPLSVISIVLLPDSPTGFNFNFLLLPFYFPLGVMEEVQDSGPGPEPLPTQHLTPDHLNNKAQDPTPCSDNAERVFAKQKNPALEVRTFRRFENCRKVEVRADWEEVRAGGLQLCEHESRARARVFYVCLLTFAFLLSVVIRDANVELQ